MLRITLNSIWTLLNISIVKTYFAVWFWKLLYNSNLIYFKFIYWHVLWHFLYISNWKIPLTFDLQLLFSDWFLTSLYNSISKCTYTFDFEKSCTNVFYIFLCASIIKYPLKLDHWNLLPTSNLKGTFKIDMNIRLTFDFKLPLPVDVRSSFSFRCAIIFSFSLPVSFNFRLKKILETRCLVSFNLRF